MDKIVLDEELRSRLNGMTSILEIHTIDGTTVGYFVPEEHFRKMLYACAESQNDVTPEELQRRCRENKGKGKPLAEIKRLHNWAMSRCPFADDELQRRQQNLGGGRPLADFWPEIEGQA
jgi:hypothetical protein